MSNDAPPSAPPRIRRSRSLKVYVIRDGEVVGPYSWDDVRRRLVSGHFSLRNHAWHNRLTHWVRLESFNEARKITSPEKYEMPPPPPGVKMRPPESRSPRERKPQPVKKLGFTRRLLRRFLGTEEDAEAEPTPILTRLQGGHLEGAALAPGQAVNLFCRSPRGRSTTVRLTGLRQMRLDGFREENLIHTTHLYGEKNAPQQYLARLEEGEEKPRGEGWVLLVMSCHSGCEFIALFDRAAMDEYHPAAATGDDPDA